MKYELIPSQILRFFQFIPGELEDGVLNVTIPKSTNAEGRMKEISSLCRLPVALRVVTDDIFDLELNHYLLIRDNHHASNKNDLFSIESKDVVKDIISSAIQKGASDIHLEKYSHSSRIRLRVDGKLLHFYDVPTDRYSSIVNKIKVAARLDISEKRLPQDGRLFLNLAGQDWDIRVSIVPSLHGEKIVLRLLGSRVDVSLDEIGLSIEELVMYKTAAQKATGIILISGPTGSGKTTTLYSTLKFLNRPETNILTVEDPVEYTLLGINQIQVRSEIGLDFARALRSFLRQDPDIIMVGEIRDSETAQLAIRAAMTGHLVLSTIHTNSAWATIGRLIDLGIPGFLIASTLNISVAQRLVRILCENCKQKNEDNQTMEVDGIRSVFLPAGCPKCNNTGFKGRRAIYEVIVLDTQLSNEILQGNLASSLILKERGFVSLKQKALLLVRSGVTTLEEVMPHIIDG